MSLCIWFHGTLLTQTERWKEARVHIIRQVRKIYEKRPLASTFLSVCLSVCLSACLSVRPYVRMTQLCSHPTYFHGILIFPDILKIFKKIQFALKSDKNNGTLHEDRYTFVIISRSFLISRRNVSDPPPQCPHMFLCTFVVSLLVVAIV